MGLFFAKGKKGDQPKPFIFIHSLIFILMPIVFVLSLMDDFSMQTTKYIYFLLGTNYLISGIESYRRKEQKEYKLNLGFAIVLFIMFFLSTII